MSSATTRTQASGAETIHVQVEQLDQLLHLTGQIIIINTRLMQMQKDVEVRYEEGGAVEKSTVAMVKATAGNSRKIADRLQDLVMSIRMVPIQQLFRRFPRMVRDMARAAGKNVELQILGEATRVDRSIRKTWPTRSCTNCGTRSTTASRRPRIASKAENPKSVA